MTSVEELAFVLAACFLLQPLAAVLFIHFIVGRPDRE